MASGGYKKAAAAAIGVTAGRSVLYADNGPVEWIEEEYIAMNAVPRRGYHRIRRRRPVNEVATDLNGAHYCHSWL